VEVAEMEARELVREEERRAKAREAEEERMIQQQMKALRYRFASNNFIDRRHFSYPSVYYYRVI
jgi:hypothetical protein